jgi:hypothetical protein
MKKYTMMVLFSFSIVSYVHSSPDAQRIGTLLSDAGPKAFGSFRMFENSVNEEGLRQWNGAISEGLEIVERSNKNNKQAREYVERISKANNELINSIKGLYNVVFLPASRADVIAAQQMQMYWDYKNKMVAVLEQIQQDMADIKKQLQDLKTASAITKMFKSTIAEKDVLIELVSYIAVYAQNAVASVDFKYTTNAKFKASIPQERSWVGMR